MSDEILVAYATRHESTRGIAAEIADVLERAGLKVRLEAVDAVGDLRAYRAAIVGCTVFEGEWMSGACHFLQTHERQLEALPVWLFASGSPEPLPRHAVGDVPPELVGAIERIGPRDVALFAGSLQPHHVGSALRVLSKLSHRSFADQRDRAAVKRWAEQIAVELAGQPEKVEET